VWFRKKCGKGTWTYLTMLILMVVHERKLERTWAAENPYHPKVKVDHQTGFSKIMVQSKSKLLLIQGTCGNSRLIKGTKFFQPFFTTNRQVLGTGWALVTFLNDIVKAHGGWVESVEGEGTEFMIFVTGLWYFSVGGTQLTSPLSKDENPLLWISPIRLALTESQLPLL